MAWDNMFPCRIRISLKIDSTPDNPDFVISLHIFLILDAFDCMKKIFCKQVYEYLVEIDLLKFKCGDVHLGDRDISAIRKHFEQVACDYVKMFPGIFGFKEFRENLNG